MTPLQAYAKFQSGIELSCRVNYVDHSDPSIVTMKREYPAYSYNSLVGISFSYGVEGSGGDDSFKGVYGYTSDELPDYNTWKLYV